MSLLKGFAGFFRRAHKDFEIFQIEASTSSSLDCPICPRSALAEEWIFQQMDMETFRKIAPSFPRARWVVFAGWGDPLENENIAPMLRMAAQAGCRTSLETPGILLTEDLSRRLLAAGLNHLVISLEAAQQALDESARPGSEFQQILDNVRKFVDLKKEHKGEKPGIKLSLPMTRLNVQELPGIVPLAMKLGVDEVALTNLDYLPNERGNILRTFYHESPTLLFQEKIDETRRLGKKAGIPVRAYPLKMEEVFVCEANPPGSVFFSVDGSVAPCRYLRLPKKGEIPRIFWHQKRQVPQTFFGNVNQEDFLAVWEKEAYRNFRRTFEDRKKSAVEAAQVLDALANMRSAPLEEKTSEPPPPLPEVCRTCYKAYGI